MITPTKKTISFYLLVVTGGILLFVATFKSLQYYPFRQQTASHLFIKPEQTGKEGKNIPNFKILLADSVTYIESTSFIKGKSTVFFYFSPYCPFCEEEMKSIKKNINKLKNIQFLLITPFRFDEMRMFYKKMDLGQYSNIHTGIDYTFFFGPYFHADRIPYMAIYGKTGKLNGAFIGNLRYEQIIEIAQK